LRERDAFVRGFRHAAGKLHPVGDRRARPPNTIEKTGTTEKLK
jgi:hypothetical protein